MSNETSENNHNRRGKPSKHEQFEIERTLRLLFLRGLSTYAAVIETGYSINTVRKYYNKFYKEITDLEGKDFAQECKNRKVSAYLSIGQQISKLEHIQKEVELKLQTDEKQYVQLCKLRIDIAKSISDLTAKRLGIANSPTHDEMLAILRKEGELK